MSILSPATSQKKQLEYINRTVDKKGIRKLLAKIYEEHGAAKTGALANALKDLGFRYATLAGVTISIDDLSVPPTKKDLLASAESEIETATQRFIRGEITEVERYTKVIDTWSDTTEQLTKMVIDHFDRLNPVYMMAFSGARGNISQVRQLVGMRGLMADSQGQIIDMPIKSNFKEGLSVTEYIISSYGARKGLVDTALKTADSGYLTRRLVDVAQDVIITEPDCGTQNGIPLQAVKEGEKVLVPLEERIVSRTSAVDVVTKDGEVLVQAGQVITRTLAQKIADAGVLEVLVRSALTCDTYFGICQQCYGWSLTNNRLVDIGEAIGIMAAQSIGEPGTQLTMRTFHTGGAVSGSSGGREAIRAKNDGVVVKAVRTRDIRTRHGDVVNVTAKDTILEVKTKDGVDKYNLPVNTTVLLGEEGAKVKAGDALAELDPFLARGSARRLTEKATKDINTARSGEIHYDGFDADEKRDRQGNISRTANRAGTIWVLGGDVYNLPSGAKNLVQDGAFVEKGEVLAESLLISEHGGEVRVPESLTTETMKVDGKTVNAITGGKELTIIIASIQPSNAELALTKKERLWKVNDKKIDETFIIKAPDRTTVENGSIVAELIDDTLSTTTSGEIRYEDLEVDEQRIITKPGKVYFIPEEVHQVSKDISLKIPGVESGQFVQAGTEVVKGVVTRTAGILELVEENDIVREVIVRPGELFEVSDVTTLNVDDGAVVDAGAEVAPGVVAKERSMVTINFQMDMPEEAEFDADEVDESEVSEYAEVILRPVQEFFIEPREVNIDFESTEPTNIRIVPITQIQFNDGDRVRQIEGAPLIRTSLVIQMSGFLERLKGLVEIEESSDDKSAAGIMKIVVLENLTIRRDAPGDLNLGEDSVQTHLLVNDGQQIEPKTPLVKTQALAKTGGKVSLGAADGERDVRRLLLISPDHLKSLDLAESCSLKKDDFVKVGDLLDGSTPSPVSGRVAAIEKNRITLRQGRPYLISAGAQLQNENRAICQRGDLIATLIFERQKTGDIVQGLPRVEELLEGRKPKEIAIIAKHDAAVEIVDDEEGLKVYMISDHGREELQMPIGSNILVEDKQHVRAGQPITDGAVNPHELLEVSGIVAVRKYLVDEVQRVYRSQGVEIADKHVEVIVRQMSKKVRVDEGGDTVLLIGELVDEKDLNEHNRRLEKEQIPAQGSPVLLGITKASLNTESFISAASFQETTRVLTEAAVEGKKDYLRGLKENVIIGRLIPAGTGFPHFIDERVDMIEETQNASKSGARKPSAILEEIESMFGSPEITPETLSDFLLDDDATLVSGMSEEKIDAAAEDDEE
ncbi:MAG: DNA-directed RNA polymerase subunit beta'' [Vampirovibrionales bacterium]|nr:DNA-directed RNA polymerase subunit beta'' [Vampirovibrionales bacterium]